MGKVLDYDWSKEPQDLIDFKDNVRDILNNGKSQSQSASTAPTHAGNIGERFLFLSGTDGRVYHFTGFAWDITSTFEATTA